MNDLCILYSYSVDTYTHTPKYTHALILRTYTYSVYIYSKLITSTQGYINHHTKDLHLHDKPRIPAIPETVIVMMA